MFDFLKQVRNRMIKQAKRHGMKSALHCRECLPLLSFPHQWGISAAWGEGCTSARKSLTGSREKPYPPAPRLPRHLPQDATLPTAKKHTYTLHCGLQALNFLVLQSATGLPGTGWHLLRHSRDQRCELGLSSHGGLEGRSQKWIMFTAALFTIGHRRNLSVHRQTNG